jgi:hypothetical protein
LLSSEAVNPVHANPIPARFKKETTTVITTIDFLKCIFPISFASRQRMFYHPINVFPPKYF